LQPSLISGRDASLSTHTIIQLTFRNSSPMLYPHPCSQASAPKSGHSSVLLVLVLVWLVGPGRAGLARLDPTLLQNVRGWRLCICLHKRPVTALVHMAASCSQCWSYILPFGLLRISKHAEDGGVGSSSEAVWAGVGGGGGEKTTSNLSGAADASTQSSASAIATIKPMSTRLNLYCIISRLKISKHQDKQESEVVEAARRGGKARNTSGGLYAPASCCAGGALG